MIQQRPLSVTILAWVYIAVGTIGLVYHVSDLRDGNALAFDGVWIELVRLLAIVAGAYMLRGHNWARWLALVWIAFHVVVSVFNGIPQLAMHALFSALFAWLLFRAEAARYFAG
jgi:hypothetical protein